MIEKPKVCLSVYSLNLQYNILIIYKRAGKCKRSIASRFYGPKIKNASDAIGNKKKTST